MVEAAAACSPSSLLVTRMARWTVVATFGLILAGGLVTSRDAGLAVPDWPLSFGTVNPPRWLQIVNVRTEHGHRLIAGIVALLTITLAWTTRRQRERLSVRRVASAAAALVLFQALLGGLRVLHLSVDLAMVHALTAQVFLCTVVALATITSPSWRDAAKTTPRAGERRDATAIFVLVLAQLLLGIVIRHLGAAARPLLGHGMFHAHVTLALAILWLAHRTQSIERTSGRSAAAERAAQIFKLVLLQIGLGVASFLVTESMAYDRQATALESWLPSLHVLVGACILGAAARSLLYATVHPLPAQRDMRIGVTHVEESAR